MSKYKTKESVRIFFQIPIETASKHYPQKLENRTNIVKVREP